MNAREMRSSFERGVHSLYDKPRGDEAFIHNADVKGCNIATYARLQGRSMLPHATAKLVMFQMGHAGEAILANALAEGFAHDGWAIERGTLAWLQFTDDDSFVGGRLRRDVYPTALVDDATGVALYPGSVVVGNMDILASKGDDCFVTEAKTVDRAFPKEVRWDYATQTQIYVLMARAILKSRGPGVVGVIDRRKGDYTFYDVPNPLEHFDTLRHLSLNALACYDTAPPENTDPPQPWMCKFCDYGDCARNENPERFALQEAM
jgi:hypothetical protein